MYKELDRKVFNRLDFEIEFQQQDYEIKGDLIKIGYSASFDIRLKDIDCLYMTVPVDQVLSTLALFETNQDDQDLMICEEIDLYLKKKGHEYSENLKKRLNIDQLFTPKIQNHATA